MACWSGCRQRLGSESEVQEIRKRKADPVQLLVAQNTKTGIKLDDMLLIDDLRGIDEDAANRYLEHVVISKRIPSRVLHEQLLMRLLDQAEEQVQNDGVKYHLEELGQLWFSSLIAEVADDATDSEYRLESEPRPYCIFFADVAPDTPIKLVRLKLMLYLQGSPFYDLAKAADRLESISALKPELAVVLGRVGYHC